jgi:hypothetical protein
MQEFTPTLTVLSAMITPAILILATGQLILTTSQRLARVLDRTRKLSETWDKLMDEQKNKPNEKKVDFLLLLMKRSAKRANVLQRAMSTLYIAISFFVLTSASIGFLEMFDLMVTWLPVAFGLAGILLLFYSTIILIFETHAARGSVHVETEYILKRSME